MPTFAKPAFSMKQACAAFLLISSAALVSAHDHGGGHPMGHGMGQPDPAKMQAHMAKHQEALKAKLKLTPDQEAAWSTYTASTKLAMDKPLQRPDRAEIEKLPTPERIDKMRALHNERHTAMTAHMEKLASATKTFYAVLTADQKKVFDANSFMGAGHPHRGQHGGQHHG